MIIEKKRCLLEMKKQALGYTTFRDLSWKEEK